MVKSSEVLKKKEYRPSALKTPAPEFPVDVNIRGAKGDATETPLISCPLPLDETKIPNRRTQKTAVGGQERFINLIIDQRY